MDEEFEAACNVLAQAIKRENAALDAVSAANTERSEAAVARAQAQEAIQSILARKLEALAA